MPTMKYLPLSVSSIALVVAVVVAFIGFRESNAALARARQALFTSCIRLRDAKMNAYITSHNPNAVLDQSMPEACTHEFLHQF